MTYVLIDWGTSSFRLWHVNGDGEVLNQHRSGQGMSTLTPDQYEPLVEELLSSFDVPADTPVLICGMAGAAQGWHPVPYVDLPAPLVDLYKTVTRVPNVRRDVRILPGLAQRVSGAEDVMRGEETLLLGGLPSFEDQQLVCLPGTHSKWVSIQNGEAVRFHTAMTGEVYALLSKHSTLSHYLETDETQAASDVFQQAVCDALEQPALFLNALFSLRAKPLLDAGTKGEDLAARLSGLLIGTELAGMLKGDQAPVALVSSGALAENYAKAFEIAGQSFQVLESEQLTLTGLLQVARKIWA